MGRGTKRKQPKTMWSSSGSSRRSKKSQKSSLNEGAIEKIFVEIADVDDPTVSSMEGISKLCEQLDLDPLEDIRVLVLLWRLGANDKPAQISKQEVSKDETDFLYRIKLLQYWHFLKKVLRALQWMQGCKKLEVDSIAKLKALLPSLDTGFLDQKDFKDFFKVSHQTLQ